MKRLLVTGAQGFVGRHVRHALVQRGHTVIGVGNSGSGAQVEVDLSSDWDADALIDHVGRLDGIIYAAARITRGSSVDGAARANLRTIAQSPARLLQAHHRRFGPVPVAYCSSIKVYGRPDRPLIDPLDSRKCPDPFSYGSAKALGERWLSYTARRCQSPCAIVRPSYIYGPGQHPQNAIPLFLSGCWQGRAPTLFGDGSEIRDDVLVSDVASCLIDACLRAANGPFNACGERARSLREVAQLCCEVVARLGGPSGLVPLPRGDQPRKWWLDQRFDLERSSALLGYHPTPMDAGLAWQARWLRDGGSEFEHAPTGGSELEHPPTGGSA